MKKLFTIATFCLLSYSNAKAETCLEAAEIVGYFDGASAIIANFAELHNINPDCIEREQAPEELPALRNQLKACIITANDESLDVAYSEHFKLGLTEQAMNHNYSYPNCKRLK